MFLGRVLLQHTAIDLDAEAWLRRNVDPSVTLPQRHVREVLAERMRRGVELEQDVAREERVIRHRNRGDELQRRRLPDGGSPYVRVHLRAVRMRERDDVAAGSEAAGDAKVRLRDVDGTRSEEITKAEGGVFVLAAGDRRA